MRDGTLIGATIVAIGLVAAAIAFAIVGALLQSADGGTELRLERAEAELIALRSEAQAVEGEIRSLKGELERLTETVALNASRTVPALPDGPVAIDVPAEDYLIGDHPETDELTEEMQLAKARFNIGITQPRNRTMLDVLGQPRDSYSQSCQPVSNPRLKELIETRQVGPIRVTMLRPALDSLERVVARLKEAEPDIHDALGTAGALCARLIRGSRSSISNHSWGTAIDIKLEGKLDGFGDGGTQFGLLILAEMFNEEGWFWGATYKREDSMHFEVGEETLRRWASEGLL